MKRSLIPGSDAWVKANNRLCHVREICSATLLLIGGFAIFNGLDYILVNSVFPGWFPLVLILAAVLIGIIYFVAGNKLNKLHE